MEPWIGFDIRTIPNYDTPRGTRSLTWIVSRKQVSFIVLVHKAQAKDTAAGRETMAASLNQSHGMRSTALLGMGEELAMFTDPLQMRSMADLRNRQIERQLLRKATPRKKRSFLESLLQHGNRIPSTARRTNGKPLNQHKESSLPGAAG